MDGSGRVGLKLDRVMPERVTLLPELNQDGTWGLAAYYLRADGSRDKRVLAMCERQSDACHAMRHLWQDIWRPAAAADRDITPATP